MIPRTETLVGRAARGRRVRGLVLKEARQILRDPSSILIAIVLPLMLLVLFGYAVSLNPLRIPIGIVVEHPTAGADELVAAFRYSPYFEPRLATATGAFDADLAARRIQGIVTLRGEFAADMARSGAAPVQVLVSGAEPNSAALVQGYVQGVLRTWTAQQAGQSATDVSPISVVSRVWFNPERESRNVLAPGAIAIILTIIGALLTSLVVAREWERGTMEALLATPAQAREILISKFVPYFVLGLVASVLCVATAVFIMGVPFRGSVLELLLVTSIFLTVALFLGLLISTVTRSQFLASQVALVVAFLPAFALSGFVFEIASMPWPIRLISAVIPARYYIDALRSIFLAGGPLGLVLLDCAKLAVMAAVLGALTVRRTQARLD